MFKCTIDNIECNYLAGNTQDENLVLNYVPNCIISFSKLSHFIN